MDIPIWRQVMKKFCVTAILVILNCGVLYASYEEAVKLYESKQYQESLKMVADMLVTEDDFKAGSPNYNLRFLAAHNHWKMGNFVPASQHFSRCMDIQKNSVDPYIDLALMQVEQKKYGDADSTARKGLDVKKSSMLYYILGYTSLCRENFWRAKEMFEKAIALDPEQHASYNGLGIALMRLQKFGEANTAFSAAHVIRPRSVEILNNLGMSYEKLGKTKEAIENYTRALAIDEKNAVVSANLQRVKSKKGN